MDRRAALLGVAVFAASGSALAQAPAAKPAAAPPPKPSAGKAPADKPAPAAAPGKVTVSLNPDQRGLLAKALHDSVQDGFAPGEFAPKEMDGLLASGNPDEVARGQDTLVAGVVAYARAQHGGRSFKGDGWPKEWATRPAAYAAEQDFAFAVSQDKLPDWLGALPPPFARYRLLKAELARVRAEAAKPPAKTRKRRKVVAAATGDADLKPTVAPPATMTLADQEKTLIANMERWRWMPRNIPGDRIEANAAAGLLQVYQGGQPTLAMKAVAGKPKDETPILNSEITSVVFNPAWHVPDSIAKKELYRKGRGYLKRHHFITVGGRLVQKPGATNALGQVKFDFDNPFAVYLHDTPSQAAFGRSARNVSHGCVRIEKPEELAQVVLAGTSVDSPEAIKGVIDAADTKRVQTAKPTAVFIDYWTAFPGDGGGVEYRKDVYGWDSKLLQLLAAGRGQG